MMTTDNKQIHKAFKNFRDSAKNAKNKLNDEYTLMIRESAVDAEKKLTEKESIELRKIEKEMENPDGNKKTEKSGTFTFSQKS